MQLVFQRVLLKLSGEALMGGLDYGIDPTVIGRLAEEIAEVNRLKVELAIVIGGGNLFRGKGLAEAGMERVTADHMGMLATVMNSLALQDALERLTIPTRVMSAIRINEVCEDFIRRRALGHLEKGRVVIFAAGTGRPFFTTDSAASLRAVEIDADVMLKATKVDGIYSADPLRHKDAVRYDKIDFDQAITQKLAVMDATAFTICREHDMPIKVFDVHRPGNLLRILQGETVGTTVLPPHLMTDIWPSPRQRRLR